MENNVYLGIGSNKGERLENINIALRKLEDNNKIYLSNISSVYETKPYGFEDQNNFLNLVAEIKTNIEPGNLLELIKIIERDLGRKENFKWGPREIDIDILLFGTRIVKSDYLTIPHKDMLKRDFVIEPLLEINSKIVHPVYRKIISKLKDYENKNFIIKRFANNYLNVCL